MEAYLLKNLTNLKQRWLEFLLPVSVIGCLFVIFAPLPPSIMDALLAGNIAISVVILLSTIYVRSPLEFTVFPSLLLVTTIARLALNVATTRLILTGGSEDGSSAAGHLIQSFGQFVAGDQIAIGLVIFSIIIIIQFVVITKGATRISEVAARFALDGMPGKQLSIDADLSSGAIDNATASQLRQRLARQSDFYGAMDGASKFVRGDAVAGILITAVNIVGGLVVGFTSSMTLNESVEVFTKLTIGDGLASQLPALFISIAAAMLVTRPAEESHLPRDSVAQLSAYPIVLIITAVFLFAMLFTSLPKLPLLVLAGGLMVGALYSNKAQKAKLAVENSRAKRKPTRSEVSIEKLLGNETLEMELGLELIPLADPNAGGVLLPAVTRIREKLAADLGIVLPKIRIKDNLDLEPNEYRILVQGNPIDIGTIFPNLHLAIDRGNALGPISGAVATETTEQGQAFWIEVQFRDRALNSGYEVFSSTSVLSDRLAKITDQCASQLLTRDATNQLIEETRKSAPAIVDELLPNLISLKKLQSILKRLVDEGVSIRPLGLILETIADSYSDQNPQTTSLVESIRMKLAPQITTRFLAGEPAMKACTINFELQAKIQNSIQLVDDKFDVEFEAHFLKAFRSALVAASESMIAMGRDPVFCVSQDVRPWIADFCRNEGIRGIVLGSGEIVGTYVESIGEVTLDAEQNVAAA